MIGRLCLTANLYNQNSPLGEERERERECVLTRVIVYCLFVYNKVWEMVIWYIASLFL